MQAAPKSSAKPKEKPLKSPFRRRPQPSLPEGERVYAIGDVHGRLDLFDALLEQVEEDCAGRGAADVRIVLLGDLVDRGPDSAAVVDRAANWDRGFGEMVALLGNHEAAMLASLEGERRWLEAWLGFGGHETLLSYGLSHELLASGRWNAIAAAARAAVPEAHRDWLAARPLSYGRGGYLFVHAGIRPGRTVEEQEIEDLLWIRDDFLASRAYHGAMVVHGHSIRPQVEEKANRIGIDTGAFATGRLTALGLEGAERWFLTT